MAARKLSKQDQRALTDYISTLILQNLTFSVIKDMALASYPLSVNTFKVYYQKAWKQIGEIPSPDLEEGRKASLDMYRTLYLEATRVQDKIKILERIDKISGTETQKIDLTANTVIKVVLPKEDI